MQRVSVIGLGYVGLPLAVQAAEKGYEVSGVDVNAKLVAKINDRKSPFANDQRFADALAKTPLASFCAYSSFEPLAEADCIVICVPTPTEDNMPDLTYVLSATKEIAGRLRPGQLVILESTVNPGITRDYVLPILERGGKVCGKDFFLAHCPERIDPGNPKFFVGNLNRVVGGITPDCTRRAVEFYCSVVDAKIIPLDSPEEAEFVKSWENSHRNVLIALANEAAVICDALGMDINNVLKGLQSKVDQFGLHLAQPGIGPGGHCIPEDIHYVIKKARQNNIDTRFLDAAAELNDKMPMYAVRQLQTMIKRLGEDLGSLHVAVLGMAYKPNVGDARRSPAIEVAHLLVRRAGSVVVHDPLVSLDELKIRGAKTTSVLSDALTGADVVFLATGHAAYKDITPQRLENYGVRYVLDGRNFFDKDEFAKSAIHYMGIGRGNKVAK